MPRLDRVLDELLAARRDDPLAITTVIAPTRLSALQLRRRLARRGAFAGVRFEPLARLAELIAAASLARSGRRPLARPIADYVSTRIARESEAPLAGVSDIPGYARALRQTFRRLRRGGFHDGEELLQAGIRGPGLSEIARLYSRFRAETANFYDDEDLLEAAAAVLESDPARVLPELGAVYVVPPVRLTAASSRFLDVVQNTCSSYVELNEEIDGLTDEHFILAPESASEVRGIVKAVIEDLESGVRLDEIAVFYGGDRSYRPLLAQAFEAASIPASNMPGTPLVETPVGRGALSLLRVALEDFSRISVFDVLGLAPLRRFLPVASQDVRLDTTNWQRIAREAGVTRGIDRWRDSIEFYIEDRRQRARPENEEPEWRRERASREINAATALLSVVEALHEALSPLSKLQPAASFVPPFRELIERWFERGAIGLEQVLNEIEQLGTIDSVGGSFDLGSFVEAFEANLTVAAVRDRSLGDGVLITDHRQASGLGFSRVYLCGAYEGSLPAIATSEPLIQDEDWAQLRTTHPYIEDLELRAERSKQAVERVTAAAHGGSLTWSAPMQAAGAAREHYPSSLMTEAARRKEPALTSASDLRRASGYDWLTKLPSPLAAMLQGKEVEAWELRLRETISMKQGGAIGPLHPLRPGISLIEARRGPSFTAYDGNLAALEGAAAPKEGGTISPSALETFAACGLKYFYGHVLRLRPIDEPEESPTMGAAEKGSLVHRVLQRFFQEQMALGRPAVEERWDAADLDSLLQIFEEEFEKVRVQGRAGLDIYMDHDRNRMRADLATFLDKDSDYRSEEGVVPAGFEPRITVPAPAGLNFTGFIDRVDRSPDGRKAVIIDYKTGSASSFKPPEPTDIFIGGKKLQLPIYALAAGDAEEVKALYWFISSSGGFERLPYEENPANRARFEATVQSIIDAMQRGAFPAVPGEEDEFRNSFANCLYCDFTRICSRRRIYESQAKSDDPDMIAWLQVAEVAKGQQQP
ncbi:MAG: PD-(D/E)XK nuclease family protein [Dehalococcoidia bacterium]